MDNIIAINNQNEITPTDVGVNLINHSTSLLSDVREDLLKQNSFSMPIAELSTLGAGISALMAPLRKVTQTMSIENDGLYRVLNMESSDILQSSSQGFKWPSVRNSAGKKEMAKLVEVGPISAENVTQMPIDPTMMMVAVALYSIEQQLGRIEDMEKQIISFLEMGQEAEVEADVETLSSLMRNFKYNWDNEHFLSSNHKLVLDIQRTARKNNLFYQKQIKDILQSKQLLVAQTTVNGTMTDLVKKFKYYRLSLYTLSLASMNEVLLSGNFEEEYLSGIIEELDKYADDYRDLFDQCSRFLENMSKSSIETNLMKGIGSVADGLGKFIGSIPFIKDGPVDELLQDGGAELSKNARKMEKDVLKSFADVNNPGIRLITDKLQDLTQICNHTKEICFDKEQIYLVG